MKSEVPDRDRARLAMTLLLTHREECNISRVIGGLSCHVRASYVNGNVSGSVSCPLTDKKHEFDFAPLKSLRKKNLIIAEVNRLYWDYFPRNGPRRGEQNEKGLVLCYKKESECDPYDYNFLDKELNYLARISGSRQKYVRIYLKRSVKSQQENKSSENQLHRSVTEDSGS